MQELPVVPKEQDTRIKKPDWLRVKLPIGESYKHVRGLVDTHKLHTICESGNCPNMGECWGEGTATFMILGNICTRSCQFCAVATGRPKPVEWDEPQRVAEAVFLMKVKHAVLTSVDRDELPDGGSTIWYNTIKAIKTLSPETTLETLIPDFKGIDDQIQRIIDAAPEGRGIDDVAVGAACRTFGKHFRSVHFSASWPHADCVFPVFEGFFRHPGLTEPGSQIRP